MPRPLLLLALLTSCFVEEPQILQSPAPPGGATVQACYTGPAETRGLGICTDGVQKRQGGVWGPCLGEVTPEAENCDDDLDNDCDGSGAPGEPPDPGCSTCVPAGAEVCNGKDDDCNGQTDDGGVLNACGKCQGEICYVEKFEHPADCDAGGRTCEGVAATVADGITIDPAHAVRAPDLIMGLAGRDQIVAVDPDTLTRRWDHAGPDGARVASIQDGAWLLEGDQLLRIDATGAEMCMARLDHPGTALTADARGRAFAATTGSEVQAFEPDAAVDGACLEVDLLPPDLVQVNLPLPEITGALAAGPGVVWTGSAPARHLDLATWEWEDVNHHGAGPVLVDPEGDVWFGGDDLHRLATLSHEEQVMPLRGDGIALLAPYVLTLQPDQLGRVLTADRSVDGVPYPPGIESPHGLTTSGAAAFLASGEQLARWDGDEWTVVAPVRGAELHLDQDARRGGAAITARWTEIFDGKYASAQWIRLSWSATAEPTATVEVRAAFVNDEAELASAPRCGPFLRAPADLTACPGASRARYAWVELFLTATAGHQAPEVEDVELSWTRP